ncbi:uncharacterized protein LOC126994683 [Eriocheir sinensis]|uniref:uncharacterized protein LOC126994683 n=1 Tax=Eriocheir sinensis TaxID=95602 RepID=UPI0021C8F2E9|nr:uncharacterized protein LOC126994683 [Eriocheir sinensis]
MFVTREPSTEYWFQLGERLELTGQDLVAWVREELLREAYFEELERKDREAELSHEREMQEAQRAHERAMKESGRLQRLALARLACPWFDTSDLDTQVTEPQPSPEVVSTVPCDPARQAVAGEDHDQGECLQEEALPLSPAILTVQECTVVPVDDADAQPPCVSSTVAGARAEEEGNLEPSALLTVSQEEALELKVSDAGQLVTASPSPVSVPTASRKKPPDIDVKASLGCASAPPDAGQLPPDSPSLASESTATRKKPPDINVKASLGCAAAPPGKQGHRTAKLSRLRRGLGKSDCSVLCEGSGRRRRRRRRVTRGLRGRALARRPWKARPPSSFWRAARPASVGRPSCVGRRRDSVKQVDTLHYTVPHHTKYGHVSLVLSRASLQLQEFSPCL